MKYLIFFAILIWGASCSTVGQANFPKGAKPMRTASGDTIVPVIKTDEEWKEILSPIAYSVLRESATESPFSGKWLENDKPGQYICAACKLPLFKSKTKFTTSCAWPSFYDSIEDAHIKEVVDDSHGMHRVELRCARCDGHLGHVFNDGPKPTGLRFCINSASLDFEPAD